MSVFRPLGDVWDCRICDALAVRAWVTSPDGEVYECSACGATLTLRDSDCGLVCHVCGENAEHVDKHDLYACRGCDIWTEQPCDCNDCPYPPPPSKPSEVE